MAHVAADLPATHEEVEGGHPLVGAEAGLAREVVQVSNEPVQEVLQPFIFALVVDPDSIGIWADFLLEGIQQGNK